MKLVAVVGLTRVVEVTWVVPEVTVEEGVKVKAGLQSLLKT